MMQSLQDGKTSGSPFGKATPTPGRWRQAGLGLLLALAASVGASAGTPLRGLACLRSSSAVSLRSLPVDLAADPALVREVYVLYPAVAGPGRSVRALRADFRPFWLDLAVADDKALDPLCLVGVEKSGTLHRLDVGPDTWQGRLDVDANDQVAATAFGR